MRCKALVVAGLSIALALGACATAEQKKTCSPMLSWAAPAFRCVGMAPAPEPEPEPAPEPEPEPPPEPEERVKVAEEEIEIGDTVQFETGSAKLLEQSEELLNEVAKVMNDHPELEVVSIEGHTDSRAGDRYNLKLSKRRAKAVQKYLVSQGVAKRRLRTKGFGEKNPVADNETEDGRFQNRRVEFKIIKRAETPGAGPDAE